MNHTLKYIEITRNYFLQIAQTPEYHDIIIVT